MRTEVIIRYLGYVLLFNAFFLALSFFISWSMDDTMLLPFAFATVICLSFGLFPFIFIKKNDYISFNEGLFIVVWAWLITFIIGMLPYLMYGGEFTLVNAWFESVSGFTTTGSTILNDIEALPKSLLFWRSSTHWMGGMGIIMFMLLILPRARNAKLTLFNMEMSELSKSNFRYRARTTVYVLATVYIGLTVLETTLLWLAGMEMFDAVNHSFATIATGGFSTKNLSVAHFNNPTIEVIIIVFMLISGIHFGLIFGTLTGKKQNIFNSSIVKAFIIIMLSGVLFVSLNLYYSGIYDSFLESLRYASFQVISLGSTTGFATADTAYWPGFSHMILIYFTIQCAMTGSTSGGLKFDRIFLFFKSLKKQMRLNKHPNAVVAVKVDGKNISEQLERQTLVFIVMYVFTFFVTTLLLSLFGVDLFTAFSASIATLGNVGPGFGEVSSLANFDTLPAAAKFFLTINMFFGRLEIFSIIAFVSFRKRLF